MTYIAKPKLRHPGIPVNKLGFTHRDYEGSVSTLCAPAAAMTRFLRHHPGLFRAQYRAASRRQAVGHRLFVQDTGLSVGPSHGFNSVHGRMPSV
jgi:2-oxoglutarate ferredoxin oxidoreductase subunit beta